MLEKLSGVKNLQIKGRESLEDIIELNKRGRTVIFAPNHIKPQGTFASLRRNSALADDFPVLDNVLENAGINSKVIARGDTDMEIGDSKLNEVIYNIHRKIFSTLVRLVTRGIPIAINTKDPRYASRMNMPVIREIFNSLRSTNLTIYPYGNWFESGEQAFDSSVDLEAGTEFVSVDNFEKWRGSLKDGFIKIAKKLGAPIVPVYIENENGQWCIVFGKPIIPDEKIDNIELAKQYLTTMGELKQFRAS